MEIKSAYDVRDWMRQHPEPSGEEFGITLFLEEMCRNIPELTIYKPLPTGLVASYEPIPKGPYSLFRADLDALPVYSSSENKQYRHVCGHDIHTAILWDFLLQCMTQKISKNLIFLFQPAEESGGGALQMLHTGLFDQWNIKKAFALHVTDAYPFGTVASAYPSLFSASCEVDLEWKGVSAHITMPDRGKDAWQACCQFQTIWGKKYNSTDQDIFLGIGKVQAGHIRNSIPDYTRMEMTLRGKTEEALSTGLQNIGTLCELVQAFSGVTYQISLGSHYPPVRQDQILFKEWERTCHSINKIIVPTAWTAEDFSFFTQRYPSLMCWLGCRKDGMPELGLHHPDFNPPSDIIPYGSNFFMNCLNL
jgi:N-acetyldiaminopimelate deacetylase